MGKTFMIRQPAQAADFGTDFVSIPTSDIPRLASEYTSLLETALTSEWCKCEWIAHPDDVNVQEGMCRECGNDLADHQGPNAADHDHVFAPRRLRPGTPSNSCPIHSKEGRILGFFEWVFKEEGLEFFAKERTPRDWLKDDAYSNFQIIDQDGWTAEEWHAQTKITRDEFELRLGKCTLKRRHD